MSAYLKEYFMCSFGEKSLFEKLTVNFAWKERSFGTFATESA